ncbi:hypothetical protein [Actinomadura sp. WMMA1423]|uniref:hypothetical protein n=1 Tax=Actinomadura sp. WMMA1423 TaxID=2591108 RepID=UPI0011473622|nr:hypothetical protein [Actinomadura sp. WMMA1423]
MINSIHEEIGWFACANLQCRKPLDRDHVTLVTTAHMRRFCSVLCITEGQVAWHERLTDPNVPEYQRYERELQAHIASGETSAASAAIIARVFADHPDWFHRGPCCECPKCGGNECVVWNPDWMPEGVSGVHICPTCQPKKES